MESGHGFHAFGISAIVCRFNDWSGIMKVLILGFKKSGKAAYELLKNGNKIAVYDEEKITFPGIEYYDKRRLKDELPLFDLCVRV